MKNNWQTKKLGEVCDIYQPKTISLKDMNPNGKHQVYGANGVIGRYDKYNHEESQLLITCRGATCGSVNISTPKSWITGNAMVVKPKDTSLNLKYLEYMFRGGIDIQKVITGAAQPQITRSSLEPVEISYPESILEQKRIVRILDEVFKNIDKAKENAEKNLHNSKELFETYLNTVFSVKGKLKLHRFDEICQLQRGFDLPTRLRKHGIFPLVSSNGITDKINLVKVKSPGVVTGRSGTIGKVHFITEDFWPLNTSLYVKNFFENDEKCIYYFLRSFDLNKYKSGAGVPTLNRNNVHSKQVYFPDSITKQKEIVKKLDELSEQTKKLEGNYKQKLLLLDELKKSVLQKAFSGNL